MSRSQAGTLRIPTLRGSCAVIFHATGGDAFGLDAVTPVPFTLGVVVSQSRDGRAIREIEDIYGRRHRVNGYTYRLPGLYPCALLAATRTITETVSTVSAVRRLVRGMIHWPEYRAAVIAHDLDRSCCCAARRWRA